MDCTLRQGSDQHRYNLGYTVDKMGWLSIASLHTVLFPKWDPAGFISLKNNCIKQRLDNFGPLLQFVWLRS